MPKQALLVVDVQNDIYGPDCFPADKILVSIGKLLDEFRAAGDDVIFVQQTDENLVADTYEWRIVSDIAPLPGETIIRKIHNSAFRETGLAETLRNKGVDTVVLVGMVTQYCINATREGALEHGFSVITPRDANAAHDTEELPAEKIHRLFNTNMWKG